MNLRTPLVVLRWVLVVLAVAAWLIVIPLVELASMAARGARRLARTVVHRRDQLAVVTPPRALEPATGDVEPPEIHQRRAG